jgi:hypothetical protein
MLLAVPRVLFAAPSHSYSHIGHAVVVDIASRHVQPGELVPAGNPSVKELRPTMSKDAEDRDHQYYCLANDNADVAGDAAEGADVAAAQQNEVEEMLHGIDFDYTLTGEVVEQMAVDTSVQAEETEQQTAAVSDIVPVVV